jgi:hypothetical protein
MSKSKGPTFIRASGNVKGLTIENCVSVGAPLLDGEGATITDLTMRLNQIYGAASGVRLGDVFGAEISGNLFDVRLPEKFVAEIKEAAKSPGKMPTFLANLGRILTKPSEIEAIASLAERLHHAWTQSGSQLPL